MTTRILVIDDSTTLRKLVEIAMRGSGIDVDFAATGTDGVARARATPPDTILLDFLLPDLTSAEVCQRLEEDRTTSQIPIVIMSANQPTVFASFAKFPQVVDFVGKPFTPTEIRNRLERAIALPPTKAKRTKQATTRSMTEPPVLSAMQLAAVTKSFQEVLQPRLAALQDSPNDLVELLLAPDIVAEIVAACGGIDKAHLQIVDGDLQLRGNLMTTPLLEVLRLLASSNATGTLVIELADRYWIHLRRGGVLMCTTSRFDEAALGMVPMQASTEVVAQARRLQHTEGRPVLISLAQAGVVRVSDLPAELHAAGGSVLAELLGTTAGRFTWSPSVTLPDYVDAFGRHLSITSIALARHRSHAEVSLPPVFLDEVYDRTPRFSDKLSGARLNRDEQRLLALIDGRFSVREILGKTDVTIDRAAAIFSRLRNVDLIRSESASVVQDITGGSVIVVDSDEEGFVGPLRAHFARRPQPIEVLSVESADLSQIAQMMMKLRPRLVVINSQLVSAELVQRELAPISRAGTMALTAVLDFPDPIVEDAMLKAGVHAVLTKPLHINDLERMTSFQ